MRRTSLAAPGVCLLAALSLLLLVPAPTTWATDWKFPLPRRAFAVQGGDVALQGGICRNRDVEPVLFGKLRYPTKYFLILRNETDAPVYADVQWRVPDTRKLTTKGDEMSPGEISMYWRFEFGVKAGEPIPFTVTVYADEGRTRQLGIEESALYFEEADRKAFLEKFNEPNSLALISGWREMKDPRTNIPGTASSAQLQRDIQFELWKRESIRHRDCEHQVVAAAAAGTDASAWLTGASAELQHRAGVLHTKEAIRFEEWQVKSCDVTTAYHLAMRRSPRAGTDFLVTSGDEPADPAALSALVSQAEAMEGIDRLPASSGAATGTPEEGVAGGASDFVLQTDHRDQFTIELPRGWRVSDEAAKAGHPGPVGVIVFSSEGMTKRFELGPDPAQAAAALAKWAEQQDSGGRPSFFVDRHKSQKGSSCAGLSNEEKNSLLSAFETRAFGSERVRILEPTQLEAMRVGGCQGLRVLVRAASKAGENLFLLVYTVSDGTTTYDFSLRNREEFFGRNRPTFDRAVASLKLARAG